MRGNRQRKTITRQNTPTAIYRYPPTQQPSQPARPHATQAKGSTPFPLSPSNQDPYHLPPGSLTLTLPPTGTSAGHHHQVASQHFITRPHHHHHPSRHLSVSVSPPFLSLSLPIHVSLPHLPSLNSKHVVRCPARTCLVQLGPSWIVLLTCSLNLELHRQSECECARTDAASRLPLTRDTYLRLSPTFR
jgi:hypothetical protein